MSQSLIDIVNSLYAALPEQDWDTYQSHLHQNFSLVESNALPYAGTYRGIEGLLELIGKVFEMFSEFNPTPRTICADKNCVMVWVDISLTARATGKSANTQLIEVFTFEGDKLVEICPFYFDTQLVHELLS